MLDAFAKLPVWQRALLFGVVALLLCVGWYFVFFADALEQTQAATAGLAKAKAELAEAEKDRANYAERRKKVEEDERKLAEQREVLPLASAASTPSPMPCSTDSWVRTNSVISGG